ncbi:hypothetical protein [Phycicoccus sp. 3266]|uniref:hypothetical protein n=1 Tax=Phycicoccus sp. 3266 TaxID=2817751 RepID=UPI00285423CA|nr:hypothetical protein [Phycicoccus sp. 3266]MDR6862159.1 hypothetical protein [Phycicoccus sp. 3266]
MSASNEAAQQDVMVGWVAPAMCHSRFAASLGELMWTESTRRRIGNSVYVPSGPQVSAARTSLVDRFLASALTWLLMLDSDMTFTPDDMYRLLDSADAQQRLVVGAMYRSTGQDIGIANLECGWFDDDHPTGALLPNPETARGLIPVDFVGAGAMVVHRTVFERVAQDNPRPQPWFQEVVRHGRVDGNDYEFCRRVTAAGIPIHLNADVRLGHIKPVVVRAEGLTPR